MSSKTTNWRGYSVTIMCAIALGAFGWAGCDRSGGGASDKAESQPPSPSEESADKPSPTPSAGSDDKPNRPGSAAGEKPSADKKPSMGKKPSAGADKKPKPGAGKKPTGGKATGKGQDYSKQELEKFVEVTRKLKPMRAKFKKELSKANSKTEAKKAQKKIMNATRSAAEEAGLDFQRFQAISRNVKRNPSLQKRLRSIAMSKGKNQGAGK